MTFALDGNLQPLRRELAETLALQALSWIARTPETAMPFLSASGVTAQDLKARAADPEFLAFILDYLLADEGLLLEFCRETATAPDRPLRARAGLPGGADPHWT